MCKWGFFTGNWLKMGEMKADRAKSCRRIWLGHKNFDMANWGERCEPERRCAPGKHGTRSDAVIPMLCGEPR